MMLFKKANRDHHNLLTTWLKSPHVSDFFYGQGLQNTLDDLKLFIEKKPARFKHWIAFKQDIPFGYLMTSNVLDDDSDPLLTKWKKSASAMTLDLLIGDKEFLGKGYASKMIKEFVLSEFPDTLEIFIDPEVKNTKAIHVYEKAGFKKLETFIPDWNPKPHILMKATLQDIQTA